MPPPIGVTESKRKMEVDEGLRHWLLNKIIFFAVMFSDVIARPCLFLGCCSTVLLKIWKYIESFGLPHHFLKSEEGVR